MKNIKYIVLISVLALLGCNDDFDFDDRGFNLEELPSYVAFNPSGTMVTFTDIDTD